MLRAVNEASPTSAGAEWGSSPLMQRLRGVRQLGMAHLVYPGAGYDRLEHSRGVVEAAERMIAALSRNAGFRREFGQDKDEFVPTVSDDDRRSIRLAALLHDTGHGAYSHATEMLIQSRLESEFDAAANVLRASFAGAKSIAPSETIAVLIILSEALQHVFEHPRFGASTNPTELPAAVCARILGARDHLSAGYLSGVVSGPLDADKLDYMARDSHHAGLPIGLDLHRLISKLEVVTVTPENATNPEMRKRAQESPQQRFHEIGISVSGLGAYEQMVIARVILYDRLYYHHKIRAAEAMVRRLIQLAEEERGRPFSVGELFFDVPDDTVIPVLGGILQESGFQAGSARSGKLATAIQTRELYYRAFAFAPRFIAGLSGLPEADKRDAKATLWTQVLGELSTIAGCDRLAQRIFDKAQRLTANLGVELAPEGDLQPENVVVDLPVNKTVVRGGDILTRTEGGYVAPPNLFFDPERWSQAYEHQKQCGFVYTPRRFVRLVNMAARIVFFEDFEVVMDSAADRASKTAGETRGEWFARAAEKEICSGDLANVYQFGVARLVPIRRTDLEQAIPENIRRDDPTIVDRLRQEFVDAVPTGFAPRMHKCILDFIRHGFTFCEAVERNGDFVGRDELKEAELQSLLRKHILAREGDVTEGSEEAGGETDLILSSSLVIENKVLRSLSSSPLTDGERFSWQARRYSLALCQHLAAEVVAYRPKDESAHLPVSQSIAVSRIETTNQFSVIRLVIPWGMDVPSRTKPPGD
jgi:HD superfamily phosphohydrolase